MPLAAAGSAGSIFLVSALGPAQAATSPRAQRGAQSPQPTGSAPSSGATPAPSAAPPSGATSPSGAAAKVAVPQGIDAAALNAKAVFPTASGTKETVSFVLKARSLSALEARVGGGMRGGFLTVSQFASQYGQPHSKITELRQYLAGYHLKTTADADGLDVTATGTAADFDQALSVSQQEYKVKAVPATAGQAAKPAVTIHGTTDQPLLPATLAAFTDSILGLTNYPIFGSSAVHTLTPEQRSAPRAYQLGNGTPADFASEYGLTPLYKKGADGKGQTIGIITYASMKPADATYFWTKVLKISTKAARIRLDDIDGGAGPVSYSAGSGESTLDVEQSGALAPDASIVVYQAPNSDYGAADAYFAAASQDKASVVSTSWGFSEIALEAEADAGQEAATYGAVFDEAYLEMAAQGQTAFNAAGDTGAYDDLGDQTPYTELSVDNPADSPWATTVGGTTNAGEIPLYSQTGALLKVIRISAQRTWGWDWMFPYYSLLDPGSTEAQFASATGDLAGGGGGYSSTEKRPGYQSAIKNIGDFTAVPYLTPTQYELFPGTKSTYLPTSFRAWDQGQSGVAAPPTLVTGQANGRAVPDLVADADPYTGYEEYFSGFPAVGYPALAYGWGGTSFVAPQMAGAAAVIDSYLGRRAGFWNPAIYKFAAGSRSPFTPLDSASASNDNLYYSGTRGHVFNPGSGLGTPDLAKLAADFRAAG